MPNRMFLVKPFIVKCQFNLLNLLQNNPSPFPFYLLEMTVLGTAVMFHSALSFIRAPGSVLFICTASVIWRNIASSLNVPVIDIKNGCISPPCSATQCRHSGELSALCDAKLLVCSNPLVKPFPAVSPLYVFFLHSSSLPHTIL